MSIVSIGRDVQKNMCGNEVTFLKNMNLSHIQEIEHLEKALDKACDIIALNYTKFTKEQWKDYLLSESQNY